MPEARVATGFRHRRYSPAYNQKILEPYGEDCSRVSAHVRRAFQKIYPGDNFQLTYTGIQEADDGSHCGHISTWNDITSRMALLQGCDLTNWEPDPPPALWFAVVSEILYIRDLQIEVDLTTEDFRAIGVTPLFQAAFTSGKPIMHDILRHLRQYRNRLSRRACPVGRTASRQGSRTHKVKPALSRNQKHGSTRGTMTTRQAKKTKHTLQKLSPIHSDSDSE